jgi:hypothetical protein
MMRRCVILLALLAPGLPAGDVIDRIVATVGKDIITLSEVGRELRVSAFEDDKPPDLGPAAQRAATERLVDRALIGIEIESNRYPAAERVDALAELENRKKRFRDNTAYEAALKKYGIHEEDLLERLEVELTVLRFIDFRFRLTEQPSPSDVEKYYKENFVPLAEKNGVKEIPPLDQVQNKIEEILTRQRMDLSVEEWLREARKAAAIHYHPGALDD